MSKESKEVLIKRLKSLSWRVGMMLAAIVVDFLITNIGLFELPDVLTVVLGLMLGEVSKYLNSKKDTDISLSAPGY